MKGYGKTRVKAQLLAKLGESCYEPLLYQTVGQKLFRSHFYFVQI